MSRTMWILVFALALSGCKDETPQNAAAGADSSSASVETDKHAAQGLASLSQYLGKYPKDRVNFLEQEPLSSRLRALVGERYADLQSNLGTVGPLREEDGAMYLLGNKPHEGGRNAAAIVIDPRQDALYVWLLVDGLATEFRERDMSIPMPKDVQKAIGNAAPKP